MSIPKFDNDAQATQAMQLALGRIFRLCSRPFQEGDIEQYENAKWVAIDAGEYLGRSYSSMTDDRASYARDYHKINKD